MKYVLMVYRTQHRKRYKILEFNGDGGGSVTIGSVNGHKLGRTVMHLMDRARFLESQRDTEWVELDFSSIADQNRGRKEKAVI